MPFSKSPENIRIGHWCGHVHPGEEILPLSPYPIPSCESFHRDQILLGDLCEPVDQGCEPITREIPRWISLVGIPRTTLAWQLMGAATVQQFARGPFVPAAGKTLRRSLLPLQASCLKGGKEYIPCRRHYRGKKKKKKTLVFSTFNGTFSQLCFE